MPSESPQNPRNRYETVDESAAPEGLPVGFEPQLDRFGGGPVFPYRGTQTHGVEPQTEQAAVGSPENDEGGAVEFDYVAPVEDAAPVPVRIVDTAAHEYSDWRANQSFANPSPNRVVNRKEGRKSLTIKNIGTVHVWVGPDSNVSPMAGYRVDSGGGTFTLDGEAEVWAVSNDATAVPLCIYFEFSTPER